jgi:hypothetical protein
MFKTKLVGYNRPTSSTTRSSQRDHRQFSGRVTFISGRGALSSNTQSSYIRYQLANTITSGEFSVLVEGLAPNAAGSKFKIFSMQSGPAI